MRTFFEVALAAATIYCAVMWLSTDLAMKGLLLIFKEKGYERPTNSELDAYIEKAANMQKPTTWMYIPALVMSLAALIISLWKG